MKIFAERVLELRKEKNLSQAKLAKMLGVSYSLICYWENDKADPTATNIVKVASFFNVSTDFLLGMTDY